MARVPHPCLDCGRPILTGSRCPACREKHRPKFSRSTLRDACLQRDGYRCRRCGRVATPANPLQMHHIQPLRYGGQNTLANAITLCHLCHILVEHDPEKMNEVMK